MKIIPIRGSNLYGDLEAADLLRFREQIDQLVAKGVREILLYIDTPGGAKGSTFDLIEHLNTLKVSLGLTFSCFIRMAHSAGFLIALACDHWFIDEQSESSIHFGYFNIEFSELALFSCCPLPEQITKESERLAAQIDSDLNYVQNRIELAQTEKDELLKAGELYIHPDRLIELPFIERIESRPDIEKSLSRFLRESEHRQLPDYPEEGTHLVAANLVRVRTLMVQSQFDAVLEAVRRLVEKGRKRVFLDLDSIGGCSVKTVELVQQLKNLQQSNGLHLTGFIRRADNAAFLIAAICDDPRIDAHSQCSASRGFARIEMTSYVKLLKTSKVALKTFADHYHEVDLEIQKILKERCTLNIKEHTRIYAGAPVTFTTQRLVELGFSQVEALPDLS